MAARRSMCSSTSGGKSPRQQLGGALPPAGTVKAAHVRRLPRARVTGPSAAHRAAAVACAVSRKVRAVALKLSGQWWWVAGLQPPPRATNNTLQVGHAGRWHACTENTVQCALQASEADPAPCPGTNSCNTQAQPGVAAHRSVIWKWPQGSSGLRM